MPLSDLKILLLSPLPPPTGGIATWTKLILNSDIARNKKVDVINTALKGQRIENVGNKKITDELFRALHIYKNLKKSIKKNYDIVHLNSSCSRFGMFRDYIYLKKVKKSRIKIVIHFHCDTRYMVRGKLSEYIFKKICLEADRIFTLNSSSYKHIKILANKESKVMPNFIDLKDLKSFNFTIRNTCIKKIIFVGNVTKSKGCEDILAIATKLPEINFELIGRLSKDFKNINLPSNVKMFGELSKEKVLSKMCDTDMLLFPTYTEGFPNVVLEAMALGLPIVSTPVGAIPDMIENNGGVLVDVGNIDGFVTAINKLQNSELRKNMSEWNKKKVESFYVIDLVSANIFDQYLDVKVITK